MCSVLLMVVTVVVRWKKGRFANMSASLTMTVTATVFIPSIRNHDMFASWGSPPTTADVGKSSAVIAWLPILAGS